MAGLETEDANRRHASGEMLTFDHRQSDPAHGEHASEMAMREQSDAAALRTKTLEQAIGATADVSGRLAMRAAVAKDVPARPLLLDLGRAQSFVIAIVPFGEVRFDRRGATEPGKGAGSLRAQAWAGEDSRERDAGQERLQRLSLRLAVRGERDFGAAGVLARERPFGLPMSNDDQPKRRMC